MKPHEFESPAGDTCHACGKSLYHEEHFGGSRAAAAEAYHSDKKRLTEGLVAATAENLTLASRVRITDSHPVHSGRKGIVTYVELETGGGFATVQLDHAPDRPVTLPMNFPMRYLEIVPLVVPSFSSQQEAEEWLERNNPVIQAEPVVPRFQSVEEADRWAEEQRCKDRGWTSAAEAREAMGLPPRPGGPPQPGEAPKPRTTAADLVRLSQQYVGLGESVTRASDSMMKFQMLMEERVALRAGDTVSFTTITNIS